MRSVDDFTPVEFYEQFRFRPHHFWEVLQALRWTEADGSPRVLRIGKRGHHYNVRCDHLLMVLIRRLAFPARWTDIKKILGGSKTTLCVMYNWALADMYWQYHGLVEDIHIWKGKFATFAARLTEMGCPYHNLIGFFDGHFDPTARPGGDACRGLNLHDFQTYSFLHGDHGLMYQGCVLGNGMAMCWGPYLGKDHDAKTYVWTGAAEDLHAISEELGTVYSFFADSAYPRGRYMQVIIKSPAGGSLSRTERRHNALMARFRVLVENLFAEITVQFHTLCSKSQKKMGKSQVGKMFPVCVFLYNLRSLYYGNQAARYFGTEELITRVSARAYCDLAFE